MLAPAAVAAAAAGGGGGGSGHKGRLTLHVEVEQAVHLPCGGEHKIYALLRCHDTLAKSGRAPPTNKTAGDCHVRWSWLDKGDPLLSTVEGSVVDGDGSTGTAVDASAAAGEAADKAEYEPLRSVLPLQYTTGVMHVCLMQDIAMGRNRAVAEAILPVPELLQACERSEAETRSTIRMQLRAVRSTRARDAQQSKARQLKQRQQEQEQGWLQSPSGAIGSGGSVDTKRDKKLASEEARLVRMLNEVAVNGNSFVRWFPLVLPDAERRGASGGGSDGGVGGSSGWSAEEAPHHSCPALHIAEAADLTDLPQQQPAVRLSLRLVNDHTDATDDLMMDPCTGGTVALGGRKRGGEEGGAAGADCDEDDDDARYEAVAASAARASDTASALGDDGGGTLDNIPQPQKISCEYHVIHLRGVSISIVDSAAGQELLCLHLRGLHLQHVQLHDEWTWLNEFRRRRWHEILDTRNLKEVAKGGTDNNGAGAADEAPDPYARDRGWSSATSASEAPSISHSVNAEFSSRPRVSSLAAPSAAELSGSSRSETVIPGAAGFGSGGGPGGEQVQRKRRFLLELGHLQLDNLRESHASSKSAPAPVHAPSNQPLQQQKSDDKAPPASPSLDHKASSTSSRTSNSSFDGGPRASSAASSAHAHPGDVVHVPVMLAPLSVGVREACLPLLVCRAELNRSMHSDASATVATAAVDSKDKDSGTTEARKDSTRKDSARKDSSGNGAADAKADDKKEDDKKEDEKGATKTADAGDKAGGGGAAVMYCFDKVSFGLQELDLRLEEGAVLTAYEFCAERVVRLQRQQQQWRQLLTEKEAAAARVLQRQQAVEQQWRRQRRQQQPRWVRARNDSSARAAAVAMTAASAAWAMTATATTAAKLITEAGTTKVGSSLAADDSNDGWRNQPLQVYVADLLIHPLRIRVSFYKTATFAVAAASSDRNAGEKPGAVTAEAKVGAGAASTDELDRVGAEDDEAEEEDDPGLASSGTRSAGVARRAVSLVGGLLMNLLKDFYTNMSVSVEGGQIRLQELRMRHAFDSLDMLGQQIGRRFAGQLLSQLYKVLLPDLGVSLVLSGLYDFRREVKGAFKKGREKQAKARAKAAAKAAVIAKATAEKGGKGLKKMRPSARAGSDRYDLEGDSDDSDDSDDDDDDDIDSDESEEDETGGSGTAGSGGNRGGSGGSGIMIREVGRGVVKGTLSLGANTVFGVSHALATITRGAGTLGAALSMDNEYVVKRKKRQMQHGGGVTYVPEHCEWGDGAYFEGGLRKGKNEAKDERLCVYDPAADSFIDDELLGGKVRVNAAVSADVGRDGSGIERQELVVGRGGLGGGAGAVGSGTGFVGLGDLAKANLAGRTPPTGAGSRRPTIDTNVIRRPATGAASPPVSGQLLLNAASSSAFASSIMGGAGGPQNSQGKKEKQKQEKGARTVGQSTSRNLRGDLDSMVSGVTGVVTQPIKGAREGGAKGFVVGIGKGAFGFVTKPAVGMLDAAAHISEAVRDQAAAYMTSNMVPHHLRTHRRQRLSHVFSPAPDSRLLSYSATRSHGSAVLSGFKTHFGTGGHEGAKVGAAGGHGSASAISADDGGTSLHGGGGSGGIGGDEVERYVDAAVIPSSLSQSEWSVLIVSTHRLLMARVRAGQRPRLLWTARIGAVKQAWVEALFDQASLAAAQQANGGGSAAGGGGANAGAGVSGSHSRRVQPRTYTSLLPLPIAFPRHPRDMLAAGMAMGAGLIQTQASPSLSISIGAAGSLACHATVLWLQLGSSRSRESGGSNTSPRGRNGRRFSFTRRRASSTALVVSSDKPRKGRRGSLLGAKKSAVVGGLAGYGDGGARGFLFVSCADHPTMHEQLLAGNGRTPTNNASAVGVGAVGAAMLDQSPSFGAFASPVSKYGGPHSSGSQPLYGGAHSPYQAQIWQLQQQRRRQLRLQTQLSMQLEQQQRELLVYDYGKQLVQVAQFVIGRVTGTAAASAAAAAHAATAHAATAAVQDATSTNAGADSGTLQADNGAPLQKKSSLQKMFGGRKNDGNSPSSKSASITSPPPPSPRKSASRGAVVEAQAASVGRSRNKSHLSPRGAEIAPDGGRAMDMPRLRRMYDQVDRNGDGGVTKRELILTLRTEPELCEMLGLPAHIRQEGGSREAFERLFEAADANHDNELSWPEFFTVCMKSRWNEGESTHGDGRKPEAGSSAEEVPGWGSVHGAMDLQRPSQLEDLVRKIEADNGEDSSVDIDAGRQAGKQLDRKGGEQLEEPQHKGCCVCLPFRGKKSKERESSKGGERMIV
jgi:hypothetical protein